MDAPRELVALVGLHLFAGPEAGDASSGWLAFTAREMAFSWPSIFRWYNDAMSHVQYTYKTHASLWRGIAPRLVHEEISPVATACSA